MKQVDGQDLHSVNFNFFFAPKVGDFGLSSLKNATYLTAKSGRGTVMVFSCFFFIVFAKCPFFPMKVLMLLVSPLFWILLHQQPQWMAPEVLRSEPSNEK